MEKVLMPVPIDHSLHVNINDADLPEYNKHVAWKWKDDDEISWGCLWQDDESGAIGVMIKCDDGTYDKMVLDEFSHWYKPVSVGELMSETGIQ